jgi:GNAT superfamily N-acetyltransferase
VNELEALSASAYLSFYGDRANVLEGGAVVFRIDEAPRSPMLNRVVGLGVERPASDELLDSALQALAGTTFYVAESPSAVPPLGGRLRARGLEPGWGWMQFRRGVTDPPTSETQLELVEVGPGEAAAFARIVRTAYGLPEAVEAVVSGVVSTDWQAWLALDGDEPAGAAGLFVQGDGGYLGFAGTLSEHRGKGAQSALLSARIRRARELGCRWVATETGERQPDRASNSYRNILRAGFEEQFVVGNWLGGAT